jgi:ABC-type multidrug transport system permease subunit
LVAGLSAAPKIKGKIVTSELWMALGVFLLGVAVLVGIFATKTPGFGRFSAGVLLLAFGITIAGLFFAFAKIEASIFANVLFAVIGFAGGLLANRQEPSNTALQGTLRDKAA